MNCPLETQESSALLLAYSSGRLDSESAVRVQRHLESCSACRQFVEHQAAVWDALDLWEAEPVSADFDRRLYQRIEQQVSWWDMLLRPFRPLLLHRGLPVAAAAGMLIMAGVLLDRQATAPAVPPPESAQVEALQPDQVEHAVDEVEMLNQFNHLMLSESAADPNEKM
jgi:anti-sigma factor RsiW